MSGPANPTQGVILALTAFGLWGLFPLYFIAVDQVNAGEVLAHRIIGSALLLALIGLMLGNLRHVLRELRSLKRIAFYLVTSTLISANWLIYIWATQNERVLDASLGYFINPLVTVVLAMVFLGERLTRPQWIAVGIATVGVMVSVVALGSMPWIALSLAATFGVYGLLRKKFGVPAMNGLLVETMIVLPFAALWVHHLYQGGELSFLRVNWQTDLLLACAGIVTVLPLYLWLTSMKSLKLTTVGLLQYITPTLQFLIGLSFGEPLSDSKLVTFICIWVALIIYSRDSLAQKQKRRPKPPSIG